MDLLENWWKKNVLRKARRGACPENTLRTIEGPFGVFGVDIKPDSLFATKPDISICC